MKGFLVLLFLTIQLQNNYQNYGKIWKHFFFFIASAFFPFFFEEQVIYFQRICLL